MRLTLTRRTPASDTTTQGRQKVAQAASTNNAIHGAVERGVGPAVEDPDRDGRAGAHDGDGDRSTRPDARADLLRHAAILPDERTPR